jgi:hypothetical protein
MTFENLMERITELGISKSGLEKQCGFYKGKITELAKGRLLISDENIVKIADGLDALSEEIALLAEETRTMDSRNVGQYVVYEFTFPDGKKYYGSTFNIDKRWKNGKGYQTQEVGKAIEKFGWDNIEKRIIAENLTKQNATLIERTLIKATGSDMPGFGYNVY